MNKVYSLVKRNYLIYIRDRSAVLFSFLSMFIVLGLMLVFLGPMNQDELVKLLNQHGGVRNGELDKENAAYLIKMWTIAGIMVVNAVMVTLTVIGIMVRDEAARRLGSFYAAPVKRIQIALSYVFSAFITGTFLCVITLIASQIYVFFTDGVLLSAMSILKICGLIVINTFVFSSILFLTALFIHGDSAWTSLGTIIGTLVGFLGGIYLAIGFLPETVQKVLKCIPILHGTAVMRQVFTADALANTFKGLPPEVLEEYKTYMGITISMDKKILSTGSSVAFLLLCGTMALGIAIIIFRKRSARDR